MLEAMADLPPDGLVVQTHSHRVIDALPLLVRLRDLTEQGYLVIGPEGVARYVPRRHSLRPVLDGDVRPALRGAAVDQSYVGDAPLCLAVVMNVAKMARKYGDRAERYCLIEAGHVAQNVLLQATAIGMGCVPIGAFDDGRLSRALSLPEEVRPLYLVPVGDPE